MTARMLPVTAGLVGVLLSTAASAQAPMVCAPRDKAMAHLSIKYNEIPVAAGLAANGGFVEVLVGPDGETWSILITMPDGTACLMAAGEAWQRIEPKPGRGL